MAEKGYRGKVLVIGAYAALSALTCLALSAFSLPGPRYLLAAALLVPASATVFGVIVHFFFFKDLRDISNRARAIRDAYDLKDRLRFRGAEELRDLARSMNGFFAKVHGTIYDLLNALRQSSDIASDLSRGADASRESAASIRERMRRVADSSTEMSSSLKEAEERLAAVKGDTRAISDRIGGQAVAVSQTSAAVEQMVANIKSISKVVNERVSSGSIVESARERTEAKFSEFSEAIKRIEDSIGYIGESINVIREMSDKSNILAMNAAIEAAHAGDAGRGFGVVAEELRALSESTQESSKSISANLEAIVKDFGMASSLSDAAGDILGAFSETVGGFVQGFGEIENGLNEMSAGTGEIVSALGTLNSVTHEVSSASGRIAEAVSSFDERMGLLGGLGERNKDFAGSSEAETESISRETARLAGLGARNGSMLGIMLEEIGRIRLLDLSAAKASDGQSLLFWNIEKKVVPARPERPESLAETDKRHWYDYEYSGWNEKKLPQPPSPMDGPAGKRVMYLFNTQNDEKLTYFLALKRGAEKMAKLHGIDLVMRFANIDASIQAGQVEEALKTRPDLVIIEPTDAAATVGHLRRFYKAGIPVIVSLMSLPTEAYPYIVCYTGPDDWGQTRALARSFADRLGKKGGYCVFQHVPGSGTDFGRSYGAITELAEYAPSLLLLEKTYSGFNIDPAKETMDRLLGKYGKEISGVLVADDNYMLAGIVKSIEAAGRGDIVICSAGNCRNGMDLVKAGKVHGITYQSAESSAALPLAAAADYFEGLDLPPVRNLPIRLIDRQNVEQFYPPQF